MCRNLGYGHYRAPTHAHSAAWIKLDFDVPSPAQFVRNIVAQLVPRMLRVMASVEIVMFTCIGHPAGDTMKLEGRLVVEDHIER